jgi:phospholipid transport system substrate-binding protein
MLRRDAAIPADPGEGNILRLRRAGWFVITNACGTSFAGPIMSFSRRLLLGLPLAILARPRAASAADPGSAPALILRFYDTLLAVMKQAKKLSFDERYNRLAPTIEQTFDLGLMTRIAVGPGWAQLAPDQQQRLSAAFSRYSISTYANRFDDYGGERFEVDPKPAANPNGMLVTTGLVKSNGERVVLNYLVHQDTAGSWKVIDVYLSGTVSELATRRSEFAAVLQRSGADGLVQMIEQRTAALRTG